VYDNSGEPFRMVVDSRDEAEEPALVQSIASSVDSTIDFHCINPKYNGVRHEHSYMVSHTRHRDNKGRVEWVESRLIKISVKYENDPLAFDPDTTMKKRLHSHEWQDPNPPKRLSCYLRTPLFVARLNSNSEDDGHLFCWSFDAEPDTEAAAGLRAYILMFDAKSKDLDMVMRVGKEKKNPSKLFA
jgi:carotenoid cleavage dioxygenase-like enzyme